jgi:hypothetical protein
MTKIKRNDNYDNDNNRNSHNNRWRNGNFSPTVGTEKYLRMIVATASKQTNGSFWKTFTNGNTNNGINLTSANTEDQ